MVDERRDMRTGVPAVLWGGLALLLAVRLVALRYNATDLFFDEAQYWSWSLEPAFGYYSKPPLIAWIIGAATAVCGTSEFCIRLPAPLLPYRYRARDLRHRAAALRTKHGRVVGAGLRHLARRFGVGGHHLDRRAAAVFLGAGACWGSSASERHGRGGRRCCWASASDWASTPSMPWRFSGRRCWCIIAVTPAARDSCATCGCTLALGLGAALIAPNLLWNLSNSFATFSHTADNAKWGGALFNIGKGFEFLGAQFGVFGPVLFAALISTRGRRGGSGCRNRTVCCWPSRCRCCWPSRRRRSYRARMPTGRRRRTWRERCW